MSGSSGSILITGGTGDLGQHCALQIAKKYTQHRVILSARKDAKHVVENINKATGQSNVEFLPLDLSSLASTRAFARIWASKNYPPLVALLLNAGVQLPGQLEYTSDGLEKTFGINHVAHTLLFHLLTPYLARGARIIVTASGTHDPAQKTGVGSPEYLTAEEMAHPTPKTSKNNGMWRYGTSKLTNIMWTYALHRRLTIEGGKLDNDWTVVAFDPGLMPGTGLGRDQPAPIRFMWFHVLPYMLPVVRAVVYRNTHTAKESAMSLAWVAMEGRSEEIAGRYLEQKKVARSSEASHDKEKQDDLWRWTVEHIAMNSEQTRKFDALTC